jgi:hypothetical protein
MRAGGEDGGKAWDTRDAALAEEMRRGTGEGQVDKEERQGRRTVE